MWPFVWLLLDSRMFSRFTHVMACTSSFLLLSSEHPGEWMCHICFNCVPGHTAQPARGGQRTFVELVLLLCGFQVKLRLVVLQAIAAASSFLSSSLSSFLKTRSCYKAQADLELPGSFRLLPLGLQLCATTHVELREQLLSVGSHPSVLILKPGLCFCTRHSKLGDFWPVFLLCLPSVHRSSGIRDAAPWATDRSSGTLRFAE